MRDPKLTEQEIQAALATLPRWSRAGDELRRKAVLPGFLAAVEAVNRVAALAEAADHHPDIDIRYRTLSFALTTHDSGGLTRRDTALAGAIDKVVAELGEA